MSSGLTPIATIRSVQFHAPNYTGFRCRRHIGTCHPVLASVAEGPCHSFVAVELQCARMAAETPRYPYLMLAVFMEIVQRLQQLLTSECVRSQKYLPDVMYIFTARTVVTATSN